MEFNNLLQIWKSTKLPLENGVYHWLQKPFFDLSLSLLECKREIPTYSYSANHPQKQVVFLSTNPTYDERST